MRMFENGSPRKGFSTGSTAAAAVKASIRHYFGGELFDSIKITMPGGESATLGVAGLERRPAKFEGGDGQAVSHAAVIKDSGDDECDATNGIKICADFMAAATDEKDYGLSRLKKYFGKLSVYNIIEQPPCGGEAGVPAWKVIMAASKGIGIAARPGLPVQAGMPAVNPVPLKMIGLAAKEELSAWTGACISGGRRADGGGFNGKTFISVLSVPDGEAVAVKTLNPRLGIEGGISILGTTGYVVPISTKAWLDTIKAGLYFLSENGAYTCVFTPGRYSEKAAMKIFNGLPPECFIEIGDYVSYSVRKAVRGGMKKIIILGQFGKIVKIAQGARNTNAKYGGLDLDFLGRTAGESLKEAREAAAAACGCGSAAAGSSDNSELTEWQIERLRGKIVTSNTSRQAYGYITSDEFKPSGNAVLVGVIRAVLKNLRRMADGCGGERVVLEAVLISYEGETVCSAVDAGGII